MTILACDLGGARMKIGIVRAGRLLARTVEPANSKQGLAPQLPVLKVAFGNRQQDDITRYGDNYQRRR